MSKDPRFLHKKIGVKNIISVVSALTVVAGAAAFSSADNQKVVAQVQSRQASDDGDEMMGAPLFWRPPSRVTVLISWTC